MPNVAGVQFSRKQIDALAAYFQLSYDRKFALSTAISAHLALPGLRGFWPMSGVGTVGLALDMTGLGNHLVRTNDVDFGYDNLIPFAEYNGVDEYHSITDAVSGAAYDITGIEGYIKPAARGLTIGGLFQFDDAPGVAEYLISKWDAGADRSYVLWRQTDGTIKCSIRDPTPATTTATTIATTTTGIWYSCVGKFDTASGDVFVYLQGVEAVTAAAIASINLGAADFTIGASGVPSIYFDGRAAFCFVCAESLSKTWITTLHALLRALFE